MSCFNCAVSVILLPFAVLGFVLKFIFSLVCCSSSSRRVVGIFSRSAPEDYEWLTSALTSVTFQNLVKESRSVYISNRNVHHFWEAVQDCDFGILYHTKNRGRINITNVTDCIYDEELRYMSSSKGRVNVIVLVDDLEKDDYEEKTRILDAQPDIQRYSQDLILVSSHEKRQPQYRDRKLQDIKALISAGSWAPVDFCDYLMSMSTWVSTNVSELLRYITMTSRRRGGEGGDLSAPLLV